jgi:hypothetical protein
MWLVSSASDGVRGSRVEAGVEGGVEEDVEEAVVIEGFEEDNDVVELAAGVDAGNLGRKSGNFFSTYAVGSLSDAVEE